MLLQHLYLVRFSVYCDKLKLDENTLLWPSRVLLSQHAQQVLSFCLSGLWISVYPQDTNLLKKWWELTVPLTSYQIWLKLTPKVVEEQDDHMGLFPMEITLKVSFCSIHCLERTYMFMYQTKSPSNQIPLVYHDIRLSLFQAAYPKL